MNVLFNTTILSFAKQSESECEYFGSSCWYRPVSNNQETCSVVSLQTLFDKDMYVLLVNTNGDIKCRRAWSKEIHSCPTVYKWFVTIDEDRKLHKQ